MLLLQPPIDLQVLNWLCAIKLCRQHVCLLPHEIFCCLFDLTSLDVICDHIKWFIMISMNVCAEENMDSLLLA